MAVIFITNKFFERLYLFIASKRIKKEVYIAERLTVTSKNHHWLESSNENQRDAVIEFNWENEWVLIHSNESYCAGLSCVAIYYVARGGSLGDILLKAAENCFPVVLFTLLSKTVLQCELVFKWKLSVPVQRSLKVYPPSLKENRLHDGAIALYSNFHWAAVYLSQWELVKYEFS